MATDLSKYDNSGYEAGSLLKRAVWYFLSAALFQSYVCPFSGIKVLLLRAFGAKIGKGVIIKPGVTIKYPWHLEVGDHVWLGERVWIDNLGSVRIGSHSCISQGATVLCGNHHYKKETFDLIVRPVRLEEGVWIGARSVVCPGVVCKSHALLMVGSVAVDHLQEFTLYRGNPAEKIRDRVMKNGAVGRQGNRSG